MNANALSDATVNLAQAAITSFYANPVHHLTAPYTPPVTPHLPYPWGTSSSATPPTALPLPKITANQLVGYLSRMGLTDDSITKYVAHDPHFLIQVIIRMVADLRASLTVVNPADLIDL